MALTPPSAGIESASGELRYPAWLSGEWSTTCTSAGFTAPIGERFVDPDLKAEVSKEVSLRFRLRFVDAPAPAGQLVSHEPRGETHSSTQGR